MKKLICLITLILFVSLTVQPGNYANALLEPPVSKKPGPRPLPIDPVEYNVNEIDYDGVKYTYVETINSLPDGSTITIIDEYIVNEDGTKTYVDSYELNTLKSVHEMDEEERVLFDSTIEEQVELYGDENPEIFRELLTDFFDATSGTAYNFHATEQKYVMLTGGSPIEYYAYESDSEYSAQSLLNGKISVRFAGAAFNVAISAATGWGVYQIQKFIIAKGKDAARRVFYRTIATRLQAWGAGKVAVMLGLAVEFALNYYDIGGAAARYIDSKDKRPNNGYLDW